MKRTPWLAAALLSALMAAAAVATARLEGQQDAGAPLVIPRLSGPVALDGRVDEGAWEAVAPLPVVMLRPTAGAAPSERTEIRVAHDGEYLYAAARMWDADPRGIRGNSLQRDRYAGDDTFELLLDTYNDNESALKFMVTPLGTRVDHAVSADGEGDAALNASWSTFWDAAATRTEQGWFAELRIPFSSLRFQDRDGRVTMGLTAFRWVARKSEVAAFPALPGDRPRPQFKPSLAADIVLEGVRARRPAYLTPYVLAGQSRAARLDAAGGAWRTASDPARDAGVDLKYGLTRDLTLDVTVNTDFAQVESDDELVNLSRFSANLPERRPFFQERAGLFELGLGGPAGLFYSRRIGLSPEGEPVRILGGARVVGRVGAWDVGALSLQTGGADSAPSENFGVLRARRRVLNATSFAGGMLTTRIGADGGRNVALGLDGTLHLRGADYLTLAWAHTFADGADASPLAAGRARVRLERRGLRGFLYDADFQWSARDFEPGIGFVTLRDFHRLGGKVAYGWMPGEGSPLRAHSINLFAHRVSRNEDGSLENAWIGPEYRWELRSGHSGGVWGGRSRESLREGFSLPAGTQVPAGDHAFHRLGAWYDTPGGGLFRLGAWAQTGSFYDGTRTAFGVRPTWNVSPRLELGGSYELNAVRFDARGQGFDAHVAQLRATVSPGTRLSAAALVQYNSVRDVVSTNLRLRYNLREGNDVFLVLNEGLNTDRDATDPVRPFSESRRLLLKYSHTFTR